MTVHPRFKHGIYLLTYLLTNGAKEDNHVECCSVQRWRQLRGLLQAERGRL